MGKRINGCATVPFRADPDVEAALVRDFRLCPFFCACREIIIDSAMKISNKFRYRRSFIGNERTDEDARYHMNLFDESDADIYDRIELYRRDYTGRTDTLLETKHFSLRRKP